MTDVTTHATPAVYGGEALASAVDIPFPGVGDPVRSSDVSGDAAKGLHALAEFVEATKQALGSAQETASRDWVGPHRDTFDDNCAKFVTSADNIKASLDTLAQGLAEAWAAAQGQQNRICQARVFATPRVQRGRCRQVLRRHVRRREAQRAGQPWHAEPGQRVVGIADARRRLRSLTDSRLSSPSVCGH